MDTPKKGCGCNGDEFCDFDLGTPSCEKCSDGTDCRRGLPDLGKADCEACCTPQQFGVSDSPTPSDDAVQCPNKNDYCDCQGDCDTLLCSCEEAKACCEQPSES